MRIPGIRAILFLIFTLIFHGSLAQDMPLLLRNVTTISVIDGTIRSNQSVLIEAGKIKAIGNHVSLSNAGKKAIEINGAGKFLIPGLWDMHVHLEGADLVEDNQALLPLFLTYGITTVRDCASDLGEQVLRWRSEIKQGNLIGPTIYTAGLKLEGKNSIWKGDLEIENETELSQMLDRLDGYKVDFVKITENTLKGDLFLKSVKAAHARSYRVSGHVPIDLTIRELVAAGFTSIEHASYLIRLGYDQEGITADLRSGKISRSEAEARYAGPFDQAKAIEGYKFLAEAGTYVCPTLIGGRQLAYLDETDHRADVSLQYLTEKYVANYQWRVDRMANDTPEQRRQRKERYQFLVHQMRYIQNAGVRIIAGSDAAALNTYVYPAESLIAELELFAEAGLTPLQILQAATINGALYFGVASTTAGLEAGKDADLVLLDKNPLEGVDALRTVQAVIARGRYFSRGDLDRIREQVKKTKLALDRRK